MVSTQLGVQFTIGQINFLAFFMIFVLPGGRLFPSGKSLFHIGMQTSFE